LCLAKKFSKARVSGSEFASGPAKFKKHGSLVYAREVPPAWKLAIGSICPKSI
jgi:hypothetical protein